MSEQVVTHVLHSRRMLQERLAAPVPRHDASAIMMTVDGAPLGRGCPTGEYVRYEDHIKLLTAVQELAARIGYLTCAETRHVTLGTAVAKAIREIEVAR